MSPDELKLFHKGKLYDAYLRFGAHLCERDGVSGACFTTWAPDAERVSVVGDFNGWDGRANPMQLLDKHGVWQVFVPNVAARAAYKYEMQNRHTKRLVIKTDPFARAFAQPTDTNAIVMPASSYQWGDDAWLERRKNWDWEHQPVNIYEVHLASWKRDVHNNVLSYDRLAQELSDWMRAQGFTHLELLPIFEHPLNESFGYQVTGYYAPTSRFGSPDDFRRFIDILHRNDLGVILDWVPLHFPKDEWGLVEFDGEPLYERDDPAMAEHPTWQTLIFNYGRAEVRNFLLSNALFWIKEFHVDGLRFDAVSSMLYLDDARQSDDASDCRQLSWQANPLGGRENLAAVRFLRELNAHIKEAHSDVVTIAEESTAWPQVSAPAARGGLGFTMKWNMGWVNDTLHYLRLPFSERPANHRNLTFGMLYAHKERFVLSLSHDEVAPPHGPFVEQMYGNEEQKFAQLRLLLIFQMTYPGKKLLFMGNEFGQPTAWEPGGMLGWDVVQEPRHNGALNAARDLAKLYRKDAALHECDFEPHGFRWIVADDAERSVIAYVRQARQSSVAVVLNFSDRSFPNYVIGVSAPGEHRVLFNSNAPEYGGNETSNGIVGQERTICARPPRAGGAGFDFEIELPLAPLSGLILASA